MNQICIHCDTKFWIAEKNHNSSQVYPTFTICYTNGKIRLLPLLKPLLYLLHLYILAESDTNSFCQNIKVYNIIYHIHYSVLI